MDNKVESKTIANRISKNNIAFVIRRIPHYREPFYRAFIEKNRHLNIDVYYGTSEKIYGGSGLIKNSNYPFAKRLRSFKVGSFIYQTGLIKNGIVNKYQLVIFEGAARMLSSILILTIRKILNRKNILWMKGWPNETRKISKIKYLIKKYFLSLAEAYIVYGNESKKSLQIYNIDHSEITVAQNTVDVQDIISKKYLNAYDCISNETIKQILTSGIPYIYNIGRIISSKRVDDLIDSFREINHDYLISLQLVIAGDGPILDELKEKVKNHNLRNVYILGAISEAESKMLYANCLFCTFPGAVGLSLNEAMAARKAVICADEIGPDSELLIHNYNGLRYEKGNIKKLAECMKYLINNQQLRDNFGQRAFETISEKATLDKMVKMFSSAVNKYLQ